MNLSYFSKKTNLYLLYKKLFEYCKNDLLINKMLNIPNLITNKNNFPLYGFHSTSYDTLSYDYLTKISKNNFNVSNNRPAYFTIPFIKNYEEVLENFNKNPNITKSIKDGIDKTLLNFKYTNDFLEYPIILACFVNDVKSKKIKINQLVHAYNKNNIYIIGFFNIKITNDNILQKYINSKKNSKGGIITKEYNIMLNLNYNYEFIINDTFVEECTIPITYIDDIIKQKGGKKNKNVLKNIVY